MAENDPWSGVQLQSWQDNPAQPAGVGQVAPEIAANRDAQAQGKTLDPWASVNFTDKAQSWFGGRNVEGPENGWDTPFYREALRQQNEWLDRAAQDGKASTYFQMFDPAVNKNATGIVTWNDAAKGLRAGDVFENGQKTGENLIDMYGERDAATMMAPLLFDADEQKRLFEEGGVGNSQPLIDATREKLAFRSTQAEKAPTAEEYQELLAKYREEDGGTESAVGSAAAGAGATAAIGAGIGTLIAPGIGTAIGAVGGAVFGGLAGFLNRDQITEQVARTRTEVELADASESGYQSLLSGVRGWSGVAMTAASPFQNTVQGIFDEVEGDLGDGVAEFYEIDPITGERKASGAWEAVNLGATAGDMFAQFAGGPGRALYYATMSAQIGTGIGQLTTGDQFDPTAGRFRDMDGTGEWAAAIGSVGIDAVQLGVARALARSSRGARQMEGAPLSNVVEGNILSRAVQRSQNAAGAAGEGVTKSVDRAWAMSRGKTLPENYTTREMFGVRYFFGADASAPVAYRLTSQLIAPSEWTRWMQVGFRSRARAASMKGMPTADDMYTASLDAARSTTKMGAAVINAFGEAKEEGAQAYLDPITYGESAEWGDVTRAAAMGFASGFGMSMGSALKSPAAQRIAQQQARKVLEALEGREYSAEEWARIQATQSPEMLAAWAQADVKELQELGDASAEAAKQMEYETGTTTVLGRQAMEALSEAEAKEWNRSVPASGGIVVARPRTNMFTTLVKTGRVEGAKFEANEAVFSLWRVAAVLKQKADASKLHARDANQRLEDAQAKLAAAQEAGDTDQADRWNAEIREITADIARIEISAGIQQDVAEQMARYQKDFVSSPSAAARARIVEDVNVFLRDLGQGRNGDGTTPADAAQRDINMRGVELIFGRHPYMDEGSFVRFVPQVSLSLSEMNQHGEIHLPQSAMKVLGLDYDGDFMQNMNVVYLPPSSLRSIRLGGQYMQATGDGRSTLVVDVPDSEERDLNEYRQYYLDPSSRKAIILDQEIGAMGSWAIARYGPVLGTEAVREAWLEFHAQVRRGNKKARLGFIDALINLDTERFIRMGDADGLPEAIRLAERFSFLWERVGMKTSAYDHVVMEYDDTLSPSDIAQQREFLRSAPTEMAATAGAAMVIGLSQDGQRSAQQLNYLGVVRSAIKLQNFVDTDAVLTDVTTELAFRMASISSPSTQSPLEEIEATDIVFSTVRDQLIAAAQQFRAEQGPEARALADMSDTQLSMLIGSLSVPAHHYDTDGQFVLEDGSISVLQMLLRQSVQVEAARLAQRYEDPNTPASRALKKARRLTEAGEKHSYTAFAAMREVYSAQTLSSMLGDSHALIGPDMTVDTFITSLTARHEGIGRANELERLTKASPLWESGIPDPPYNLDTLLEGKITPYVLFANMTRAIVNNQDDNRARRNKTSTDDAIYIFSRLQAYVAAHTDEVAERLRSRGAPVPKNIQPADVLTELLSYDMTVGELIIKLMPVDSLRATFVRNPDTGQVVAAKWVNTALLQRGEGAAARAAKMFHVFSTFDHMRLMSQGASNLSEESTEEEQLDKAGETLDGIPFERVTSRLEQTIFYAQLEASKGNPWPKAELRRAMFQTNSTDEMYEMINASPTLRGDRAPLLAYFDDVADYEIRPTDLYRRTLPSAALRESFSLVRERLDTLVPSKQAEVLNRRANDQFVADMEARLEELGGSFTRTNNPETKGLQPKEPVDTALWQLLVVAEERSKYQIGVGPTARLRAMEASFEGVLDLADKGKGDKNLSLVGGTLPLNAAYGLAPGIDQEVDNLTRFDSDDVLSNLTKLFEGGIEVGVEEGAYTELDLTTVAGLVSLLGNSTTDNLAKAAISPMVWDTTPAGTTQLYSLYDMNQGLEAFINSVSGVGLFSNDTRPSSADAHRFLSLVESRATKDAESLADPKQRQAYNLRVQNLLHDFLVAYSVGPMKGPRGSKMHDKLVKDVAQALIEISQLDPADLGRAREKMIEEVTKRIAGTSLLDLYRKKLSPELREEIDESVKDELVVELGDRLNALELRLPQATDPVEISEIQAEIDRLMDLQRPDASIEDMLVVDQRLLLSTLRAREMFAIDWTSEETAQEGARRVVEFLSGAKKLRFRQPKVTTLYNNLVQMETLYQQDGFITLETLGATDDKDVTTDEAMRAQWDQISEWAARAYIQDLANPASPTIGTTAAVAPQDNQYYSTTYDWLVEQLFDERLLNQAREIATGVGFNKDNELSINTKDVVDRTINNLFDRNQIGPWNRLIPSMTTKVRRALAVTPVEMAIPMHGSNPVNKSDELGASWASYELPASEHLSTHIILGSVDTSVRSVLATTPQMLVKLENHFVSRITITDSAGKIPAADQEALAAVGRMGLVSDEIENSPYRVMSLRRLQERIDMLREKYGIDDYSIDIEYVDVDKKPYERKWANNVFFEGLGRAYETSGLQSLVASMFFSTGAINKEGQQRPLEYSKQADSGFVSYIMGKRGVGKQIRSQAKSVTEAMENLALELMKHTYETGDLLTDDLPSVHKLMKMRHLVRRADSSGTERLMTVDEAISFEQVERDEIAAGTRIALSTFELIPLTAKQARSFWAGNSTTGIVGVHYGAPVLNPQDVDPFPQPTEERLERIGLSDLGRKVPVFSTVFAQVRPRPTASQSLLDPLPTVGSPMSFLVRPDQSEAILARTGLRGYSELKKATDAHLSMLKNMFRRNRSLTKALEGTSTVHALNPPGTRVSEALAEASLLPDSTATVVWMYTGGEAGRMHQGILTQHEMAGDFGWSNNSDLKVLWGDPVLIDIGDLIAKHGGNTQRAYDEAITVMRTLGPRGAKFGLMTSTGDGVQTINDLAAWLVEGRIPYQKVAGSPHFFEPVTRELARSATDRALQASLSEWSVFTGQGAQLAILGGDLQLTDGAGYADYDNMESWATQVVGVFANHLSHVGPTGGREYTFGLAVNTESDKNVVARLAADLLPILKLTKLGLDELGIKDPPGAPRRRVTKTPDGLEIIEPGILSREEAAQRLVQLLEDPKQELYVGRSLLAGDFIPYITSSGDIVLHRYGFRIPEDAAIAKVLNGEPKTYPGAPKGLRIVVPEAKIEALATIPPDFKIEKMFRTATGVRATGEARLDKSMKGVLQVVGAKIGFTEMPPEYAPALERLSLMPQNNLSVNFLIHENSVLDKGGNQYLTDNFVDAFAIFGITFRQDLMDYFGLDWDKTKQVLKAWSRMGVERGFDELELLKMLQLDSFGPSMKNEMVGVFGKELGTRLDKLTAERQPGEPEDPSRRIAEVVLASLLLPGVRLENVLETRGLLNVERLNSSEQILRMPMLMTMALDNRSKFPETFETLRKRMNSRVRVGSHGRRVLELNPDWTVTYYVKLPGTEFQSPSNPAGYGRRTGKLQYVLPVPAQQNVSSYVQRYILQELGNTSPHLAGIVSGGLGGYIPDRPSLKPDKPKRTSTSQRWYEGTLFSKTGEGDVFDNLFAPNWFNPKDPAFDRWGTLTYRELEELTRGRTARAQYLQPIDEEQDSWTTDPLNKSSFDDLARQFFDILNLTNVTGSRLLMHQLIRMELGIPGPSKDQDLSVGFVSLTDALDALQSIVDNVRNHDMPTMGGMQVLMHADTYRMLFDAQSRVPKSERWGPKLTDSKSRTPKLAETWEDWIKVAFGQALENGDPFESMDEAALNGFWQTYQGVSPITGNLTVTFDTYRSIAMRSPKAEAQARDVMLITGDEALLTPVITPGKAAGLDAMTGKSTRYGRDGREITESRSAYHARRRAAWRAKKKMSRQDPTQSIADYRRSGARYIENNNQANVLFRNLSLWSLTNRMFNFGIYASAFIGIPIRKSHEYLTNLVLGTSLGKTGEIMSKLPNHAWSQEEVALLEDMIKQLGKNGLLLAEIQNQVTYAVLGERSAQSKGLSKFSTKLEDFAGWMTRVMSDPWSGMSGENFVREYIGAAMVEIAASGSAVTPRQLVDGLRHDPLWIKHHFEKMPGLSPHKAGMNRLAQVRSMKPTMMSVPFTNAIQGLMRRPGATSNIAGHLLHMQFMFVTFNANAITTLTGMSGWDQAIAMFFSGRPKPKFMRNGRGINELEAKDRWNFEDVLETVDLQRTFIRSDITFSMLMALGMMAGNLGLDGDDEEAKRRERLARYLNVPIINNPYEPQNNFKFANAIYLDSIPILNNIFRQENGESVIVPHWTIRQFTSPILGMQRFFDTGDLREIAYGFQDALSVIPNSVTRTFEQANVLADSLADQTAKSSREETIEGRAAVNQFAVNIVTAYEKILLENQFINTLYTASDQFDRDPYAIPRINDVGMIEREEGTGLPLRTDATQAVVGADGALDTPYMKRTPGQATLYAYTENNLTAAVLASLFTGKFGESDYLRQNMVVKQRSVELPETTEREAEALVLAAYHGAGGTFALDKDELIRLLKANAEAGGVFWDQGAIENQADAIIASHSSPELAMSKWTEEYGEVLTEHGAERLYESLWSGSIELGHPALRGIAIPIEMRNKVASNLIRDLTQDAVDAGLSYESAKYVAKRIWYGDPGNPESPGMNSLLRSGEIPTSNRVPYNQLNVMYMIGPDGRPWATPFERSTVAQAFGLPVPHQMTAAGPGTHIDKLGNVVDDVLGINTGLSSIVRVPEPDVELEDPFDKLPKTMTAGGGSGGQRWGSSGGSGYFPPFIRMDDLPYGTSPRAGGIPMVNTSNPYIRRANVNRERVFGERGRLKQWQ